MNASLPSKYTRSEADNLYANFILIATQTD